MDLFKSVFSDDDPQPSDLPKAQPQEPNPDGGPNPVSDAANPNTTWSFGGLIKTIASKSESVMETYRRDFEDFGSGLRKETAVIREVASRAVKDLPASLEIGASVAQESLESVGQAIDDIGSSVWKSTAGIISHGRGTLLASDHDDSDSSVNVNSSANDNSNRSFDFKRYSRFEMQVRAIQCDVNTYSTEPEDLEDYEKWRSGFVLDDNGGEIENLIGGNGVIGDIYKEVVPSRIDGETFWSRYFYKVHKLKQAEDARAKLVKRAISGEEEDLSWDFDDDDDVEESLRKGDSSRNVELEKNEASGVEKYEDKLVSELSSDKSEDKYDQVLLEGKLENAESCKDSDVSVVSSQQSLPEEDLGWDEIEDIVSNDESKGDAVGSTNKADLRKRLSAAEEEDDLSWDIEVDDEPVKP